MKLIGMLDSPYVRRTAIALKLLGLTFTHESLSVFSTYDAFAQINPVVKAPSLITDDGIVLMDSGVIIDYAQSLVAPGLSLAPADSGARARAGRIVGLALAACEKTVQIVYERNLRPTEKQHQPWLDRVRGQLAAAYRLLEAEMRPADPWLFGNRPLLADITSAVAFRFTREMVPEAIESKAHSALAALSGRAEQLPVFQAYPHH
jgi:glutathione S-transferase